MPSPNLLHPIDPHCSMGSLLSRVAAGDGAALEEVYRGYREQVLRVARRVTDSPKHG